MRNIGVSTGVFAAIWAARKEGEDSEDAILTRLLGSTPAPSEQVVSVRAEGDGVLDARNGVLFREGTEIFRTYRGRRYSARATAGVWLRQDNNTAYASLNRLNASIVDGSENVWNGNWKYQDEQGVHSINKLRRDARS